MLTITLNILKKILNEQLTMVIISLPLAVYVMTIRVFGSHCYPKNASERFIKKPFPRKHEKLNQCWRDVGPAS